MADFLIKTHSKTLDFVISWAILEHRVHIFILAPRTLSSLTPPAHISLRLTIVIAVITRCQRGTNCFVRDGFQQHFHVHKLFSHLIASKHSTNLRFKARQASTTIIIPCCGGLIMQICPIRL